MKCPACDHELTELIVGRLRVDACQGGCGGIWFDNFELKQVNDPHEFAGAILEGIEPEPSVAVDTRRRRHCPKCRDIVMMRHFYSRTRQVEVDTCPGCGGIWLDHGELAQIREQQEAGPARKSAAAASLWEVLSRQGEGRPRE